MLYSLCLNENFLSWASARSNHPGAARAPRHRQYDTEPVRRKDGLLWFFPIAGGLVVLGQMSLQGVLSRVEQLGDRLGIALDAGAKQVLIPTVNAADFRHPARAAGQAPRGLYSEPSQAAFKALAET